MIEKKICKSVRAFSLIFAYLFSVLFFGKKNLTIKYISNQCLYDRMVAAFHHLQHLRHLLDNRALKLHRETHSL